MNYLAGTTRPDIIYAVNQCAKYSIYIKQYHEESVKSIGRYLKTNIYKGLFFTPNGSNEIEFYSGEDLSGS